MKRTPNSCGSQPKTKARPTGRAFSCAKQTFRLRCWRARGGGAGVPFLPFVDPFGSKSEVTTASRSAETRPRALGEQLAKARFRVPGPISGLFQVQHGTPARYFARASIARCCSMWLRLNTTLPAFQHRARQRPRCQSMPTWPLVLSVRGCRSAFGAGAGRLATPAKLTSQSSKALGCNARSSTPPQPSGPMIASTAGRD